jgi:NMD protein affecting ribosome stability and mRNA decay
MPHRKCAICGEEIESGSFCKEHAPKGITYAPFEVSACKCGKLLLNGSWKTTPDMTGTVRRLIKEHVKEKAVRVDLPDIKPPVSGKQLDVEAEISRGEDTYFVPVRINGRDCDICKQHGGYWEGIIQTRNMTPERTNALFTTISKHAPRIRIMKTAPNDKGVDYYVTNHRIAASIAEKLHRRLGGTYISAPKIFTRDRQTQKEVYRVTYNLVFPDFEEGDVIVQDDKIVLIQSMGKQCKGLDLKTGKRALVEFEEEHEKLEQHKTEVVQTSPKVLVLHPKTFQAEPLQNDTEAKAGTKVSIVIHNGIYAIPSNK